MTREVKTENEMEIAGLRGRVSRPMDYGAFVVFALEETEPRLRAVKVEIFDVVLQNVPAGKSPATHLEEQINSFLMHYPNLQVSGDAYEHAVVPSEPASQPGSEAARPSDNLFTTLFYQ